jgi:hypothetical protein
MWFIDVDGSDIFLNGLAICCHIFRVARSARVIVLPRNCCHTDATSSANTVRQPKNMYGIVGRHLQQIIYHRYTYTLYISSDMA